MRESIELSRYLRREILSPSPLHDFSTASEIDQARLLIRFWCIDCLQ